MNPTTKDYEKAPRATTAQLTCTVCGHQPPDAPVVCPTCGAEKTLKAGDPCPMTNNNCSGILSTAVKPQPKTPTPVPVEKDEKAGEKDKPERR